MITDMNLPKNLRATSNHNPVANHRRLALTFVPNRYLLIDPAILSNGLRCNHSGKTMLDI